MSRQRVAVRKPDLAQSYDAFPEHRLGRGHQLHRVCRGDRRPWWFCADGQCRFDVPAPDGTCYLGEDEIAGLLEVIGPDLRDGVIASTFVEQRVVRTLRLPSVHRLADTVDRRAAGLGCTNEIATITPYDVPQAWAEAFRQSGFDGVRYRLRFDTGRAPTGIALFGKAGERRSWPRGTSRRIDAQMCRQLADECGITIADVPTLAQLRLAPS